MQPPAHQTGVGISSDHQQHWPTHGASSHSDHTKHHTTSGRTQADSEFVSIPSVPSVRLPATDKTKREPRLSVSALIQTNLSAHVILRHCHRIPDATPHRSIVDSVRNHDEHEKAQPIYR